MIINQKKIKVMIFNFTNDYQFTTRLELKGDNIVFVDKVKILGTIMDKSLSWDQNCQHIIRKLNARMQLLRSVFSFGAIIWHNSLTNENVDNLERTQKSFTKMLLREKYKKSFLFLNIENFHSRRASLCKEFAQLGFKQTK